MKIVERNWIFKLSLTGAALIMMTGSVNAANVVGGVGQLILNIDHDKMKNYPRERESPRGSGNFVPYSSFIEHYYDQATANKLKGYELIANGNDGYQPEASTSNLVFEMNGSTVVHPLTTIDPTLFPNPDDFKDTYQHYLQATNFYFDPDDVEGTAQGQLGFGGVLRIGFGDLTKSNPDLGFGVQGIGDFSLSFNTEESAWEMKTNTGTGNPATSDGVKPFDLKDVVVDVSVENMLTISGILTSTNMRDGVFSDARFVPGEDLGTFTMTTATTVPVPGAVWLFGTGLLGLVGAQRRKKA